MDNQEYWNIGKFPFDVFTYLDLKENDFFDTRYFSHIFSIRSYLTTYGKHHEEEVISELKVLLTELFNKNQINYIFYFMESESRKFPRFNSVPDLPLDSRVYYDRKDYRRKKNFRTLMKQLVRQAENNLREKHKVPNVGEMWVGETLLYQNLCQSFPSEKIIRHASPDFLQKQHYDVYFPEYKIAIEYHGQQHFEPVDFFGGEDTYEQNVKRDERKAKLSLLNDVSLIIVEEGYDHNELINKISENINAQVDRKIIPIKIINNKELRKDMEEKRKNYVIKMAALKDNHKLPLSKANKYRELIQGREDNFKDISALLRFQLQNKKYFTLSYENVLEVYDEYVELARVEKERHNYSESGDALNRFTYNWFYPAQSTFHAFSKYFEKHSYYEKAIQVVEEEKDVIISSRDINERLLEESLLKRIEDLEGNISGNRNMFKEKYQQRITTFRDSLTLLKASLETITIDMIKEVVENAKTVIKFQISHKEMLEIKYEDIFINWNELKFVMSIINTKEIKDTFKKGKDYIEIMLIDEKLKGLLYSISGITTNVFVYLNKNKRYPAAYQIASYGAENNLYCYNGKSFKERVEILEKKLQV